MDKIEDISMKVPEGCNIILGYSHFIKTVEDLEEIIKVSNGAAQYGIAFSEASGERLIRHEGNDIELVNTAIENLKLLSCGHTFMIILRNVYPISILNAIKSCMEVGGIFASTANPLNVIVYRSERGGSILGVVDGYSPLGVENNDDKKKRRDLLRNIGYKR